MHARLTRHQRLLCENPRITIEVCNILKPATLLLGSESPVEHNHVEVLDLFILAGPTSETILEHR